MLSSATHVSDVHGPVTQAYVKCPNHVLFIVFRLVHQN